jgi:sterol desaturase/sphingolipid hydroxylase (fatty acid hydroxylase superfamily)
MLATSKRSPAELMAVYEAALKNEPPTWRKALLWSWTALGLAGLMAFAWSEPWSARLTAKALAAGVSPLVAKYVLGCLAMAFRAMVLVESFGYMYHRFFQHVGRLTRQGMVFRRNQMFHWVHHMIIYPIGRFYKRDMPYASSEDGVATSWSVPGFVAGTLWFATKGFSFTSVFFLAAVAAYALLVIDLTHSRFHLEKHPWVGKAYFKWLEDIHILHHWDQRYNFTIVYPHMDALFGTYLAPRTHQKEIAAAIADMELTVSDLINWRYLLIEASPSEYGAFISQAHRHPRSLRKINLLLEVLALRMERHSTDGEAVELFRRATDLLAAVKKQIPGAAVAA